MLPDRSLTADPVLLAGVSLALAATLAEATAQLVDYWAFDLRYPELNGNSSAYAFSWLGALLMATTIVAFAVLARSDIHRRACYALTGAFIFLRSWTTWRTSTSGRRTESFTCSLSSARCSRSCGAFRQTATPPCVARSA